MSAEKMDRLAEGPGGLPRLELVNNGDGPKPAVPRHIAVIMDGNGRWAKKRGLPRSAGHAAGAESFRRAATYCRSIGVEYNERIYEAAIRNQKSAVSGSRVEFVHMKAEEYEVPAAADRFFFFNPFSVEIMRKVMARIRESSDGREILLFFYYPSDDYVAWLMTVDDLMFVDEIDCRDFFEGDNPRERIMIFEAV